MTDLCIESHVLVVNFQSPGRNLEIVKELREDSKTKDRVIVLVDDHLDETAVRIGEIRCPFCEGQPIKGKCSAPRMRRQGHVMPSFLPPRWTKCAPMTILLPQCLLSNRSIPDIFTVAECLDPERMALMRRSGCDSVVCMAGLASSFLVQEVCDPGTQAVVNELLSNRFGQQIYIIPVEQMQNWDFSELQAHLSQKEFLALGVQRGGEALLNPGNAYKIEARDHVICMGPHRPAPVRIST